MTLNAPGLHLTLTDLARKAFDYAGLKRHGAALRAAAPRGNGEAVLVLPGMLNNDWFTLPLRSFLDEIGYKTHAWNGGFNMGFSRSKAEHLSARLDEVYRANGNRPVALVGHSLGGVMARELARQFPEKVSKVIGLAPPLSLDRRLSAVALPFRLVFNFISSDNPLARDEQAFRRVLVPPAAPTTSICAMRDGIVNWRACLNPAGLLTENIVVDTSHSSLLTNRHAFLVVADRLAQPEGAWQPFDPARYARGARLHDGPVPAMPDGNFSPDLKLF